MTKCCPRCGLTKVRAEFACDSKRPDGLYAWCRVCTSEYKKAKRKGKPPERSVVGRKPPRSPEKQREVVRARYHANIDARRAYNREHTNEYNKKIREETPWVFTARLAEYRARVLQATPPWADLAKVKELYKKRTELRALGFDFDVDHVVPLNSPLVCGLHVPANLQLLDKSLNYSKGNRHWPDMPEAT